MDRDADTALLLGAYDDPLAVALPRFVDVIASGTAEERYEKENADDEEADDDENTMSPWTALAILVGFMLILGAVFANSLRTPKSPGSGKRKGAA
ncbi:hypothetical protein AB0M39_33790 [Streptomyces sp. NPDC051907]|uniref:hypothetical protein n=1 Tax=Streptomyces sp. NPDC051907 TaxID=3155284 RepID=UPI00342C214F